MTWLKLMPLWGTIIIFALAFFFGWFFGHARHWCDNGSKALRWCSKIDFWLNYHMWELIFMAFAVLITIYSLVLSH